MELDPTSLSNTDQVTTDNIHLEWAVDFDAQLIAGSATLSLQVLADDVAAIRLDAKALNVTAVTVDGGAAAFKAIQEPTAETAAFYGTGLEVPLPGKASKGTRVSIQVAYTTTSDCSALCWLTKEQTDAGTMPYLFSQCQAIHARSLLPCQDSPGVRSTYTANVTTSNGCTVLMSALPKKSDKAGVFSFEQPVAIASYLIAIAAGDLHGIDVSPRSRVYCEKPKLEMAASDFKRIEDYITIAEKRFGPYEWTRYDVLVLPASFPYGGMENPCLTFVSPTIVTGDASLVDVVIHEICHSWSGNLVGVANWQHFYLNEGFTMCLQRKIVGDIHGSKYADFDATLGWAHLREDVERVGVNHPFTALQHDLSKKDPDDAFSSVPYEKGFSLLRHLQSLVGVEQFDAWLTAYFATFRHKSITSTDMCNFFCEKFPKAEVDWKAWLFEPGMPQAMPGYDTTLQAEVDAIVQLWLMDSEANKDRAGEASAKARSEWLPQQFVTFLQGIGAGRPSHAVLDGLDGAFCFTESPNPEIRYQWFAVCTAHKYEKHLPAMEEFLGQVGRMKFVRPLYRAYYATHKEQARALFAKYRARYHAIARTMVAKDLEL